MKMSVREPLLIKTQSMAISRWPDTINPLTSHSASIVAKRSTTLGQSHFISNTATILFAYFLFIIRSKTLFNSTDIIESENKENKSGISSLISPLSKMHSNTRDFQPSLCCPPKFWMSSTALPQESKIKCPFSSWCLHCVRITAPVSEIYNYCPQCTEKNTRCLLRRQSLPIDVIL